MCVLVFITHQFYRYDKPKLNLNAPVAYVNKLSVKQGEVLTVFANIKHSSSARIYFLGKQKIEIGPSRTIPPQSQSPFYLRTKGYEWKPSFYINTEQFDSGYYILEIQDLTTKKVFQHPFVVPNKIEKVVVVASTNTWHAYNDYGRKSNYRDAQTPLVFKFKTILERLLLGSERQTVLPLNRPLEVVIDSNTPEVLFNSHTLRSEWVLSLLFYTNMVSPIL